jgi:hypothetical protein
MSEETQHPIVEHDGKLDAGDELNEAMIEFNAEVSDAPIFISGGYGHYELDTVFLDIKQALSLLEWLRQRELMFKQKVQDEG